MKSSDGIHQALPDRLLQMELTNLVHNLETRARYFAPEPRQLFRRLAASHFLFGVELDQLFKPTLVELANVSDAFDGPLQIFFRLVLVLLCFHLIREGNKVADANCPSFQLSANLQHLCNRHWRS